MAGKKNDIQLVASDMDGTLLTSSHTISALTKETLYHLSSVDNIPFVFATGRHCLSVKAARTDLSDYFLQRQSKSTGGGAISNDDGGNKAVQGFFLVSSNGARVHDPSGALIIEHNLEPSIVQEIYDTYGLKFTHKKITESASPFSSPTSPVTPVMPLGGADGEGLDESTVDAEERPDELVSTSAYTTDAWYATSSFLPDEQMKAKFGIVPTVFDLDATKHKRSVFDEFPVEGVGKVCFRCTDRALLTSLEKKITAHFGNRVSVALSSNTCLDVMAAGISKASALQEVGAILGISPQHMVSFGDSMNDRDMLALVGYGFIMQNAQPRLKAALPQCTVIGHHQDDGVAKKLRELFSLD